MAAAEPLWIKVEGGVARVTIVRPEVRNAFDERLISLLRDAFLSLGKEGGVRAIVLSGAGKDFCAGADLNWMRRAASYTTEENAADARQLAEMFASIRSCPKPVICMVRGAALGGALGLIATSDVVVASEDARFAFSEVKVGLVPATIAPYVVERIGAAAARRLFITGERFDAAEAKRFGLVDIVVPAQDLDGAVERVLGEILTSGPEAVREVKALIRDLAPLGNEMIDHTIEVIARVRGSEEGRAGIAAFLEKRRPPWRKD
ncbi:MAG: enoyl-CoA hydratase-related protein [Candidatus Thermoplasmatota archaeon]